MVKDNYLSTIPLNLARVKADISAWVTKAGRLKDAVELIAVSKTHPAESIREAYLAGQCKFGENYLQEAMQKQALLTDLPLEWHFIGPIQSNKTQLIARHFAWVHGVDRLKIAQRLSDARTGMPPLQICIQVNVSQEASKSGVAPQETLALAQAMQTLPNLCLRGLMAIPEPTQDKDLQHARFQTVRELHTQLTQHGFALDTLSMGMSDDYPIAIMEGATLIRLGTAIFGQRIYPAASSQESVSI